MSTVRRRASDLIAIKLPGRSRLRVSDRAFWAFCRDNPELRLERSARGDLIVMAPAALDSSSRNAGITAQLWLWNQRSGLGVVFDSSAGFTLPNSAIVGPDAAWIAADRWDALSERDRGAFAHVSPDFVVELRSASDSKNTLRKKMVEYLAQGVRLGWLIDPKVGEVEIYRRNSAVEMLARPARLTGEDILPGFVLDLNGIMTS